MGFAIDIFPINSYHHPTPGLYGETLELDQGIFDLLLIGQE